MKQIVVYKLDIKIPFKNADFYKLGLKALFWYPSLKNFIPPNKSKKYFFYWLFKYLRIFKNTDYASLLIYRNEKVVSSLLIVPAYFKWPFMKNNDVQFTFVITDPDYRGKGIAEQALRIAIEKFYKPGRTFWYLTDSDNHSSLRLCSKLGFSFQGYAKRSSFLRRLYLI